MNKAVVIVSGGIDSVVLLHVILAKKYTPIIISFDYNQRHSRELVYAKYWAGKKGIPWYLIQLPFMGLIGVNSALLNPTTKLPAEHYTDENQKITVVPNRNMIMLSIATGLADSIGISRVFYGAHRNDCVIYPDCRPEFVVAISRASELGTYNKVEIIAPFSLQTKSAIVAIGSRFNIDFTKTWSCYAGREKHCGVCSTCQERKEAFQIAEVNDPTEYEQ